MVSYKISRGLTWYYKAHLTNLRIWANVQRIWPIGQTRGIWPNAQRLVNCTRVWPNARAFGQSYQQWPNANEIRQMREHLANCATHLAKYFQNKTTYARPLLPTGNLPWNLTWTVTRISISHPLISVDLPVYDSMTYHAVRRSHLFCVIA